MDPEKDAESGTKSEAGMDKYTVLPVAGDFFTPATTEAVEKKLTARSVLQIVREARSVPVLPLPLTTDGLHPLELTPDGAMSSLYGIPTVSFTEFTRDWLSRHGLCLKNVGRGCLARWVPSKDVPLAFVHTTTLRMGCAPEFVADATLNGRPDRPTTQLYQTKNQGPLAITLPHGRDADGMFVMVYPNMISCLLTYSNLRDEYLRLLAGTPSEVFNATAPTADEARELNLSEERTTQLAARVTLYPGGLVEHSIDARLLGGYLLAVVYNEAIEPVAVTEGLDAAVKRVSVVLAPEIARPPVGLPAAGVPLDPVNGPSLFRHWMCIAMCKTVSVTIDEPMLAAFFIIMCRMLGVNVAMTTQERITLPKVKGHTITSAISRVPVANFGPTNMFRGREIPTFVSALLDATATRPDRCTLRTTNLLGGEVMSVDIPTAVVSRLATAVVGSSGSVKQMPLSIQMFHQIIAGMAHFAACLIAAVPAWRSEAEIDIPMSKVSFYLGVVQCQAHTDGTQFYVRTTTGMHLHRPIDVYFASLGSRLTAISPSDGGPEFGRDAVRPVVHTLIDSTVFAIAIHDNRIGEPVVFNTWSLYVSDLEGRVYLAGCFATSDAEPLARLNVTGRDFEFKTERLPPGMVANLKSEALRTPGRRPYSLTLDVLRRTLPADAMIPVYGSLTNSIIPAGGMEDSATAVLDIDPTDPNTVVPFAYVGYEVDTLPANPPGGMRAGKYLRTVPLRMFCVRQQDPDATEYPVQPDPRLLASMELKQTRVNIPTPRLGKAVVLTTEDVQTLNADQYRNLMLGLPT